MDSLAILKKHQCAPEDFFLWYGTIKAVEPPQSFFEPARADAPKENGADRRPRILVTSPQGDLLFPWDGSVEISEGDPAAVLGFSKNPGEKPMEPVCALLNGRFGLVDVKPLFQIPGSKNRCKRAASLLFGVLMGFCWALAHGMGWQPWKTLLWATLPLLVLSVFLCAALIRDDAVWMINHLEMLLRYWLQEGNFKDGRLTIGQRSDR